MEMIINNQQSKDNYKCIQITKIQKVSLINYTKNIHLPKKNGSH